MKSLFEEIIDKYYDRESLAYSFLYPHSRAVANLAMKIARNNPHTKADICFIENAAMLHDIGIFLTYAPDIGCFGNGPYIAHGFLGRELLEKHGLKEIAPVCERHVGVGLTEEDINNYDLPLPMRNMLPETIEERIICYADKFYSKDTTDTSIPKPIDEIRMKISKYGTGKLELFNGLVKDFGWKYIYS